MSGQKQIPSLLEEAMKDLKDDERRHMQMTDLVLSNPVEAARLLTELSKREELLTRLVSLLELQLEELEQSRKRLLDAVEQIK